MFKHYPSIKFDCENIIVFYTYLLKQLCNTSVLIMGSDIKFHFIITVCKHSDHSAKHVHLEGIS